MHALWLQYIGDLLKNSTPEELKAKLTRADFHGCILSVIKSQTPSSVGITGIVIKETQNTFQLITKENTLKVVMKRDTVFTFVYENNLCTLYGNLFLVRSAERSVKKWKPQLTLDF
uniref:Uncharacterized protein n=1 Tax=Arcella intermedia TaxID=1963864 RepID=A0A6B2LNY3_9EUKA